MAEKIGRREQKKIQSRSAILAAAMRQFSQKGYQETSVADIMNAADLGIGTFYNYFGSKEEVLSSLLAQIVADLMEAMEELCAEDRPASSVLREMTMRTAKVLSDNRFVLPLFLSAAGKSGLPAGTSGASGHAAEAPAFKVMFDRIIRRGQETGEFRADIPPGIVTEIFHSMFQAASFSSLPMEFTENIRWKLQLVLNGLKSGTTMDDEES